MTSQELDAEIERLRLQQAEQRKHWRRWGFASNGVAIALCIAVLVRVAITGSDPPSPMIFIVLTYVYSASPSPRPVGLAHFPGSRRGEAYAASRCAPARKVRCDVRHILGWPERIRDDRFVRGLETRRANAPPDTTAAARRAAPALRRLMLGLLGSAALVAFCLPASAQQGGGKFLDAKYCSDMLNLNPGSDYDSGSCQLWKLVPDADGWSRLQLKRNGKFLDARQCTDQLQMHPDSNFDNGSCQLWKFVPDADGWSRVMIKRNGKFLDADHCSDDVHLSDVSTAEGGACQLWRLVPVEGSGGWSRLQIKYVGGRRAEPSSKAATNTASTAIPTAGTTTAGMARAGTSSAMNSAAALASAATKAGTAGIITAVTPMAAIIGEHHRRSSWRR